MTILPQNFRRVITVMAMAGIVLLSGCHKGIKDDIDDIKDRLTSVEALAKSLDEQLKAGSLLKSATQEGDGWRLEFSNGTIVNVENGGAPGNDAITPKIEVRPIQNGGGYSLWYNITKDYPASGWVDTKVNIQGPSGNGGTGNGGSYLDLRSSGGYIQYTTVANPSTSDWKNLFAVPTDGADGLSNISAFVQNNNNGTATLVVGEKSYTFELYQELPHGLVVAKAVYVRDMDADVFKVTFRVNPSTAVIPTALSLWTVSEIHTELTRVNYNPNPSGIFKIQSIAPSQEGTTGEYIATIGIIEDVEFEFGNGDEYHLALVVDVNGGLISSDTFVIGETMLSQDPAWVTGIAVGKVGEDDVVTAVGSPLLLDIGEVANLAPMFTPATPDDETVEWTFVITEGEPGCITFVDGVLTAVGPGSATIKVTSEFTSTGDPIDSAVITVTVDPFWAQTIVIKDGDEELAPNAVLELKVGGEDVALTAVVGRTDVPLIPTDTSVSWTSSDTAEAVIRLVDGVITIVGVGEATITAKANGSHPEDVKTATVTVKVTPVWATGITIKDGDVELAPNAVIDMKIGDADVALTAVVEPDNATDLSVTWESDNIGAVTVVDGVISIVGEGTATITAKANGSDPEDVKTATVTVNVTPVNVASVEILEEMILHPGDTAELAATILPDNATDKSVSWASSNNAVATVNNEGLVTAVAVGQATITVTTTDGDLTDQCVVKVTLDGQSVGQGDIADIFSPDYQMRFGNLDTETGGQAWNDPAGGSGQAVYNATNVAPMPAGGLLPDIEALLEAQYAGADFVATYTILGQFGWRQQGNENYMNYYGSNASDNLATLNGRTIVPNGTTQDNQNNFGDRLVIKVTATLAPSDGSGLVLPEDGLVGYICVRLP